MEKPHVINPWIIAHFVWLGHFMEGAGHTVVNVSCHTLPAVFPLRGKKQLGSTSYLRAHAIVLPLVQDGWKLLWPFATCLLVSVGGFTYFLSLTPSLRNLPLLINLPRLQGETRRPATARFARPSDGAFPAESAPKQWHYGRSASLLLLLVPVLAADHRKL